MKVSIIIPAYNVEAYIENCLLSAFNQTYRDIEIILVDDCGQDKSIEVAEKIIAGHPKDRKVKILKHSANRGPSAARNTGIEASSGEYLYFLDSDDDITPDCIECLASLLDGQKLDFVIGGFRAIGRRENDFIPSKLPEGILSSNAEIFRSYLEWNWHPYIWNKLINKKFLLDNRLFFKEGLLYEDTLWSFMLASCAETMGVVKDSTYNYYYRDTSITAMNYEKRLPHKLSVLQLIIEYVQTRNLGLNGRIYNHVEESKAAIFIYMLSAKLGSAAKKKAYHFFRTYKVKEAVEFTIPFNGKLRDFHYLFPSFIGFYVYYTFLWLYVKFVWNRGLERITTRQT